MRLSPVVLQLLRRARVVFNNACATLPVAGQLQVVYGTYVIDLVPFCRTIQCCLVSFALECYYMLSGYVASFLLTAVGFVPAAQALMVQAVLLTPRACGRYRGARPSSPICTALSFFVSLCCGGSRCFVVPATVILLFLQKLLLLVSVVLLCTSVRAHVMASFSSTDTLLYCAIEPLNLVPKYISCWDFATSVLNMAICHLLRLSLRRAVLSLPSRVQAVVKVVCILIRSTEHTESHLALCPCVHCCAGQVCYPGYECVCWCMKAACLDLSGCSASA